MEWREIGGSRTQSVTFQPHYANLRIVEGNVVIWQTGTSTGPPPVIFGDDAQEQIQKFQHPQLEFFKGVVIPDRVMNPKYAHGFGVSKLGLRGIEVVSTSPPGREDNPDAAALQAAEEQENAAGEDQPAPPGSPIPPGRRP